MSENKIVKPKAKQSYVERVTYELKRQEQISRRNERRAHERNAR